MPAPGQIITPTTELSERGRTVYRAEGPAAGLFTTRIAWSEGNHTGRDSWRLNIQLGPMLFDGRRADPLTINGVGYSGSISLVIEPGPHCTYRPGDEIDWAVCRADRLSGGVTFAATTRLRALADLAYLQLGTPAALHNAKIRHIATRIERLHTGRESGLTENAVSIEAAERELRTLRGEA
ncbi:hypothetical protein [Nocardia sp. NPDC051570]|uniref:hypothetical protein n=1 Tax=Nocardia sp. NPDC051570 TaxID=3364324 RepID=UPI0037A5C0A0